MSQSTEPAPPRLSAGIELEFAVLYVFNQPNLSSSGPPEELFDDGLPEPTTISHPPGGLAESYELDGYGQDQVQNAIEEVLKDAGFPRKQISVLLSILSGTFLSCHATGSRSMKSGQVARAHINSPG